MPSIRCLAGAIVTSITGLLGLKSPLPKCPEGGNVKTCKNTQLSCHNTTVVQDLCCFNAPGGSLLLTQFWDFDPATGPDDAWTIHGLWPDNCDGTYEQYCDPSREYSNITEILQSFKANDLLAYMSENWKSNSGSDESFWEHEWNKHGTCISTLEPHCYAQHKPTEEVVQYFNRTVGLHQSLPSYQWLADAGITPSVSATYTEAQIQAALGAHRDGVTVYLGCTGGDELDEIWYFFNVRGSAQTGTFVPADALADSQCPRTGIRYLPKGTKATPTSRTTTAGATPIATGAPFAGRGYLYVYPTSAPDSRDGFMISRGKWYRAGGTPATYRTACADKACSSFTLTTSKGACAVSAESGEFECLDGNEAGMFGREGDVLVFRGEGVFFGERPSGQEQGTLFTGSGEGREGVRLRWQGI